MVTPADVTAILRARIRAGDYGERGPMPTLDELNQEFFPSSSRPQPHAGRAAYAPLIAEGMVEVRKGRNGGHFLISRYPRSSSSALTALAAKIDGLAADLKALRDHVLYVVEFENILVVDRVAAEANRKFGESLHPSRGRAEEFAVEILVRLGIERDDAVKTARLAGFAAADINPYGVRIYGCTLGGERVEVMPPDPAYYEDWFDLVDASEASERPDEV